MRGRNKEQGLLASHSTCLRLAVNTPHDTLRDLRSVFPLSLHQWTNSLPVGKEHVTTKISKVGISAASDLMFMLCDVIRGSKRTWVSQKEANIVVWSLYFTSMIFHFRSLLMKPFCVIDSVTVCIIHEYCKSWDIWAYTSVGMHASFCHCCNNHKKHLFHENFI